VRTHKSRSITVVPVTVRDLVAMPHLNLTVLSDGASLDGAVTWTHTSDIPEPWRWVASGELLMTNGTCVPAEPAGQVELLEHLAERMCSGLAIGANMYSPPLTPEMLDASNRLQMPILSIAFPMPFVAISRAVAEATLLEQSQRLIKTERIYRALQNAVSDDGLRSLTGDLSRELGSTIYLCDAPSGLSWFSGPPPPPAVVEAVLDSQSRERAGAMGVHLSHDVRVLTLNVPTHPDAVLACVPDLEHPPDTVLLQHTATVCALGLSQTRLTLEHDRRVGAELLAQFTEGSLPHDSISRQLLAIGLNPATAVMVATRSPDSERLRSAHVTLWREGVTNATLHRSGSLLSVVDQADVAAFVRSMGDASATTGVSNRIGRAGRMLDSEREAMWALDVATSRSIKSIAYSEAVPAVGPRTRDEASAFVAHTLSPLLERPANERDELIDTLWRFLELGRSWQRTADQMHLHRQTVRYRIKKVESLLGLDFTSTSDLATAWIAVSAYKRLDL
jgi:purine catabolism regulator